MEHDPKNLLLPETAKRAVMIGANSFYTGNPCKHGHVAPRCATTGNCIICLEKNKKGKVVPSIRGRSAIRSEENQKRAEAAFNDGKSTYTPTNPCPKGHMNKFVMSGNCVDCDIDARQTRKRKIKWARIKKEYGLSEKNFNDLFLSQGAKCAICLDAITHESAHIDHCHKSGKVRGLLCSRCNQGIGLLRESRIIMLSAIKYLEKAK